MSQNSNNTAPPQNGDRLEWSAHAVSSALRHIGDCIRQGLQSGLQSIAQAIKEAAQKKE